MVKKYLTSVLIAIFIIIALIGPAHAHPSVTLNGNRLNFGVPPVIENGTTLVPLRTIFEALEATVSWDDDSQIVTAIKENNTIKLQIGANTAMKNGQPVYLDVPSKIVNRTTLVPIRFVSEAMGCTVSWEQETQTVVIADNSNLNLNNIGYSELESDLSQLIIKFLDSNNIDYSDPNVKNYIEGRIVPTGSMMPTINLNDRVFINKFIYTVQEPQRGDIILFRPPENIDNSNLYIKRIVGIPGDSIAINNGQLYINGQVYIEPYILEPMNYERDPVKVSDNNYFVLGDNRNASYDSHAWTNNWFVPKSNIIGKVECIYFPYDHRKSL